MMGIQSEQIPRVLLDLDSMIPKNHLLRQIKGGAVEILSEEERRLDFTGLCDEDIEICPAEEPAGFFFLIF